MARTQPLNSLGAVNRSEVASLSSDERRALQLLIAEEYGQLITDGLARVMDFDGVFTLELEILVNSRLSAFDDYADAVGFEL